MPSEDPGKKSKTVGKYLRYLNLGFQLFVSIGVFTFLGLWLDRKVGTTPLFTVLGLALGFAVGFYSLYRELFPWPDRRRGASGGRRSRSHEGVEGPEDGLRGGSGREGIDTPDSKRDRDRSDSQESSGTGERNRNSGEGEAGTKDSGKGRPSGGHGGER